MSIETMLASSIMESGFSEWIDITPHGGTKIRIKAVVDRSKPNPHPTSTRKQASIGINGVKLTIYNHTTKGVTSIKENFTLVTLPLRVGDTPAQMSVKKILDHDSGVWVLEAEK